MFSADDLATLGEAPHLQCPEISDLELFVDRPADDPDESDIGSHLDACQECRSRLSDIRENLRVQQSLQAVLLRRPSADTAVPAHVGPFQIIRQIGRGGMGVVYEAQQQNPRRRVALKLLHAPYRADPVYRRLFEREAEVLARLKHPGIGAIFDAGSSADGRPYFAMELVDGVPLTEFARQASCGQKQLLALFVRICDAIGYAHQRGVVHRDLKPSNILVVDDAGTGQGSRPGPGVNANPPSTSTAAKSGMLPERRARNPLPKVLDFGLAKVVASQDSSDAVSAITELGHIRGTLPYMSPEQVRGDSLDLDIRTDVYSLGVVLYELLLGRLPYAIDRANLPETVRTICQTPPARPSSLDRGLRGDLETILLKSLEKEPIRRYASVAALGEDVQRFLDRQPILARPPTALYQLRKLVSRHRTAAALLASATVALVAFAVTVGLLYQRAAANLERAVHAESQASAAADQARRQARTSQRVMSALRSVFTVSQPILGGVERTLTPRELLDRGVQSVVPQLADEPAAQADLLETMASLYETLGALDRARELLQEVLEMRRAEPQPSNRQIGITLSNLANLERHAGREDASEAYFRELFELVREDLGEHNWHAVQAYGELALTRRHDADAEQAFRASLDYLRGVEGTPNRRIAVAINRLGQALESQGKYAEALPLMREAHALMQGCGPADLDKAHAIQSNLAWMLVQVGEFEEAEELIRESIAAKRSMLPAGHPSLAVSLTTLGAALMGMNQAAEAEPALREALRIRLNSLPEDSEPVGETQYLLGECLRRLDRCDEAKTLLTQAMEIRRRLNGESHSLTLEAVAALAACEAKSAP